MRLYPRYIFIDWRESRKEFTVGDHIAHDSLQLPGTIRLFAHKRATRIASAPVRFPRPSVSCADHFRLVAAVPGIDDWKERLLEGVCGRGRVSHTPPS